MSDVVQMIQEDKVEAALNIHQDVLKSGGLLDNCWFSIWHHCTYLDYQVCPNFVYINHFDDFCSPSAWKHISCHWMHWVHCTHSFSEIWICTHSFKENCVNRSPPINSRTLTTCTHTFEFLTRLLSFWYPHKNPAYVCFNFIKLYKPDYA